MWHVVPWTFFSILRCHVVHRYHVLDFPSQPVVPLCWSHSKRCFQGLAVELWSEWSCLVCSRAFTLTNHTGGGPRSRPGQHPDQQHESPSTDGFDSKWYHCGRPGWVSRLLRTPSNIADPQAKLNPAIVGHLIGFHWTARILVSGVVVHGQSASSSRSSTKRQRSSSSTVLELLDNVGVSARDRGHSWRHSHTWRVVWVTQRKVELWVSALRWNHRAHAVLEVLSVVSWSFSLWLTNTQKPLTSFGLTCGTLLGPSWMLLASSQALPAPTIGN